MNFNSRVPISVRNMVRLLIHWDGIPHFVSLEGDCELLTIEQMRFQNRRSNLNKVLALLVGIAVFSGSVLISKLDISVKIIVQYISVNKNTKPAWRNI